MNELLTLNRRLEKLHENVASLSAQARAAHEAGNTELVTVCLNAIEEMVETMIVMLPKEPRRFPWSHEPKRL